MTSKNKVYVVLYSFPEEGGRKYLCIYDNATSAIDCMHKARSNGSNWVYVDKREVESGLDEMDGLPENETAHD